VSQRSFVVRVSENSPRVVVEDVRTRQKVVADSLEAVGETIEQWLQSDAAQRSDRSAEQGVDV